MSTLDKRQCPPPVDVSCPAPLRIPHSTIYPTITQSGNIAGSNTYDHHDPISETRIQQVDEVLQYAHHTYQFNESTGVHTISLNTGMRIICALISGKSKTKNVTDVMRTLLHTEENIVNPYALELSTTLDVPSLFNVIVNTPELTVRIPKNTHWKAGYEMIISEKNNSENHFTAMVTSYDQNTGVTVLRLLNRSENAAEGNEWMIDLNEVIRDNIDLHTMSIDTDKFHEYTGSDIEYAVRKIMTLTVRINEIKYVETKTTVNTTGSISYKQAAHDPQSKEIPLHIKVHESGLNHVHTDTYNKDEKQTHPLCDNVKTNTCNC